MVEFANFDVLCDSRYSTLPKGGISEIQNKQALPALSILTGRAEKTIRGFSYLFVLDTVIPNLLQHFGRWHSERTHDPETEELSVGQIPNTLGQLRILLLPILV